MGNHGAVLVCDQSLVGTAHARALAAGQHQPGNVGDGICVHWLPNCWYGRTVTRYARLWDNSAALLTTLTHIPVTRSSPSLHRNILAIETATDACSVAVSIDGVLSDIHEVIPRQHSQRLLGMLDDLVPGGDLRGAGIELIAYGEGPGSFTGLRVAASAAQGLAFAAELPAVGVSTLACQVRTAIREGLVEPDSVVLSLIDARINQTYFALYADDAGLPSRLLGPGVSAPENMPIADLREAAAGAPVVAVGSGAVFAEQFPDGLDIACSDALTSTLPHARDLLPLAQSALEQGQLQTPEQIAPTYVQDRISWKKLSEQGKQS